MTHTDGPWVQFADEGKCVAIMPAGREGDICTFNQSPNDADALLMTAAPLLLKALILLEFAEAFHATCEECNGEDIPELCEKCFPYYDDARVARRHVLHGYGLVGSVGR